MFERELLFRVGNSVVFAFVDKFFDKFIRDFLPAFGVFFPQKKRPKKTRIRFNHPPNFAVELRNVGLRLQRARDFVRFCVFVFGGGAADAGVRAGFDVFGEFRGPVQIHELGLRREHRRRRRNRHLQQSFEGVLFHWNVELRRARAVQ